MPPIQLVDLKGQYLKIKDEIDQAIHDVIDTSAFIKGADVGVFENQLAAYLGCEFVLGVANGTDALQIAMMALGIGPGDEVITTPFTFIATGEAAALLGATAVFVDIDPRTFNIDPDGIEEKITPRTKAIVPVHLFGQPADMDPILAIAEKHNLKVIEDNAQSIGARYKGRQAGILGDIGTLSFFPSKNLGCYGDGGAVLTNDESLYAKMRMIANHGAKQKYYHEVAGVNSRLDTLQAAILRVKLQYLDQYIAARRAAAGRYDTLLSGVDWLEVPFRDPDGEHVFHQYTIRVRRNRDLLAEHLQAKNIPYAIYYPVALHKMPVFSHAASYSLPYAEHACEQVLSLPMHTELTTTQQEEVAKAVLSF